jgi:hypothetical protein
MNTRDNLFHVRQTRHVISFMFGVKWAGIDAATRSWISDRFGGAAGIQELATLWADECSEKHIFPESHFGMKWNELVVEYMKSRLTGEIK